MERDFFGLVWKLFFFLFPSFYFYCLTPDVRQDLGPELSVQNLESELHLHWHLDVYEEKRKLNILII